MVKTIRKRRRKLFNMDLTSYRKKLLADLELIYGKVPKTTIIEYALEDAKQFHKVADEKEKELQKYRRERK